MRILMPLVVTLLFGCSSEPSSNGAGGGNTAGAAGSSNSGGGGSGGSTTAGSGGSVGGASAGGANGGTTAGGGMSAAGTSGGGSGGALVSPAADLDGVRYEVPCGTYQENDQVCDNYPDGMPPCPGGGIYNHNETITFGGAPGFLYEVGIRVRGVVEPKPYTGGTSDGQHFYTGGTPVSDVYNVYSLEISEPPQIYYFNHDEGMGVGHYVFMIDHQKTFQVEGGASITMVALDANCSAIRNCQDGTIGPGCVPNIIPDVPPDTGYDGQLVQIDVESVSPLE